MKSIRLPRDFQSTMVISLQAIQPKSLDDDDFVLSIMTALSAAAAYVRTGYGEGDINLSVLDPHTGQRIGVIAKGQAEEADDLVHGRAAVNILFESDLPNDAKHRQQLINQIVEVIRRGQFPGVVRAKDQSILATMAIYPRGT